MEEQLNLLIERYPKLAVCKEDIKKAYELLEGVEFDNKYFRHDIGKRALMAANK